MLGALVRKGALTRAATFTGDIRGMTAVTAMSPLFPKTSEGHRHHGERVAMSALLLGMSSIETEAAEGEYFILGDQEYFLACS